MSELTGYYGSSLALDPETGHLYFVNGAGLVALSSAVVERPEYRNWKLSGSITSKKAPGALTLAAGSTFNGAGELNTETGAGTVNGKLAIPPFTATLKLYGFLPVTVGITLAEAGTLEGSLAKSGIVAGDETLTAHVSLSMRITSLGLLGLKIPTNCTTEAPVSLALADTLTREELLTRGWSFAGTTTLPRINCQGGVLGEAFGPVLTGLLSGPENPFLLQIGAPSG